MRLVGRYWLLIIASLIDEGGDWDRRNRLKVYEGMFKLSIRDFKGAIGLLVDSLATFASSELMPYKSLVKYTILAASLTLPRPELKTKIITSPEILEVIHELPNFTEYVNALYDCNYAAFYRALGASSRLYLLLIVSHNRTNCEIRRVLEHTLSLLHP